MPTVLLAIITFLTVLIISAGALSFPYITMLFGIYGAERDSVRGKLLLMLIWLFPVFSVACLYSAWSSHPYISLAPFAYILLVWSIRANKGGSYFSSGAFTTKSDILQARMDELESRLPSWLKMKAPNKYMLFTLVAPSVEEAENFKRAISSTEKLYQDVGLAENQNGTLILSVCVIIDSMDKNKLMVLIMRMVDVSWDNSCKLLSLDLKEIP